MTYSFCIFETAIGSGGLVWSDLGLVGIQLPEGDAPRVRQRIRRRFPRAIETEAAGPLERVVQDICALLGGEPVDLSSVELDMQRVPEFARRVYQVARTIGPGETMSYGEIANRLGEPRMAREVGQALARNPFPIVVPCHRVISAGGKLGGFSAAGGVRTKQRLLEIERANVAWQLPLSASI
jgi:methylated-DNA-[protein]-cysteine S-methyltransferase